MSEQNFNITLPEQGMTLKKKGMMKKRKEKEEKYGEEVNNNSYVHRHGMKFCSGKLLSAAMVNMSQSFITFILLLYFN